MNVTLKGMSSINKGAIPFEVLSVAETLEKKGHEAYLVGGCVRDLLLGRAPKDWDITTNAEPQEIEGYFEDTFYENDFGTVGIVNAESPEDSVRVVEVTPFRIEGEYSDKRRPDSVMWGKTIEEDLSRRDFTINAIAYRPEKESLVDPFDGQSDLKKKLVKAVGEPAVRFNEDALRMLRAIRIATEISFAIEAKTLEAIAEHVDLLAAISKERIRDELTRIIESTQPIEAFFLMQRLKMLPYTVPDLERGMGCDQNQAHKYDVFEHLLRTMQHGADKEWSFDIRIAGLFHDISKPETRRWSKEKNDWTFYGHEVVGARVTRKALNDLRFPREKIEKIVKLVRWHMFFSDPDLITLSAVRRVIRNVGRDNIWDLLNLRICDRIGSGRPKEQPFRFRKYVSMVEEALRDPITVSMLKINGDSILEKLGEKPGKRIGWVLHALLEEVLDDPHKNTEKYLMERAKELFLLPEKELQTLGEQGRSRQVSEEEAAVMELREKYHVK